MNRKGPQLAQRLAHVQAVSIEVAQLLVDAGYETPRKIKAARRTELLRIQGIGPAMADKLKNRER
jgi:predicted flap endonuclease-1-like 5' DNA nuclease